MKEKRDLIRLGSGHDRRAQALPHPPPPPIALPATADESATKLDPPLSPSRPLMVPATRVLIERFGTVVLYADWLPLPSHTIPPACSARRDQIVVRMMHADVLEPVFAEQLADALRTAGLVRAMTAYLLPVIRSAVKRGPDR